MRPDDYDYADDMEDDIYEDARANCGLTDDGTCMLAGTEYCDFECPFRDC
jgi:hypothetical protein